ncbi:MAG TPA: hypothetical protein VLU47_07835 [Blastocatellia bacterium]|nr:hypothetical protein [Blastocatellia bacterium]
MNLPASEQGNWGWRFKPDALTQALSEKLKEMAGIYGRGSNKLAEPLKLDRDGE